MRIFASIALLPYAALIILLLQRTFTSRSLTTGRVGTSVVVWPVMRATVVAAMAVIGGSLLISAAVGIDVTTVLGTMTTVDGTSSSNIPISVPVIIMGVIAFTYWAHMYNRVLCGPRTQRSANHELLMILGIAFGGLFGIAAALSVAAHAVEILRAW